MKCVVRHSLICLVLLASVVAPAAQAQQYSVRDEAVNARLLVAKFGRLCADPAASLETFEERARDQDWSPASTRSLAGIDSDDLPAGTTAWRDRMNGIGSGRSSTVPYTTFVAETGGQLAICGFGFENLSFDAMKAGLESSGLFRAPVGQAADDDGLAAEFCVTSTAFRGAPHQVILKGSEEDGRKGVIYLERGVDPLMAGCPMTPVTGSVPGATGDAPEGEE